MESEVTVAYRFIGMSLSPAKKEMIVMFFNHFVASFMLPVFKSHRMFFVCLQPLSNIWGGKNVDVEETAVVQ